MEFPVTCKELREDEIWVDIGLLSAEYVWEKMFGVRGFWRGNIELVPEFFVVVLELSFTEG